MRISGAGAALVGEEEAGGGGEAAPVPVLEPALRPTAASVLLPVPV